MEKDDIRSWRARYIRTMRRYRQEQRPIVYMDESYIHQSHTTKKQWSDNTNHGLRAPVSKRSKFIMIDAGGEDGFVPNARKIYEPHKKSDDYHDNVNYEIYLKWVQDYLIPNLKPNSVVAIDNAPYHNKLVEKTPNSSHRKDIIKEWLTNHGIRRRHVEGRTTGYSQTAQE